MGNLMGYLDSDRAERCSKFGYWIFLGDGVLILLEEIAEIHGH